MTRMKYDATTWPIGGMQSVNITFRLVQITLKHGGVDI